jgi:hypothetical protein
VRGGRQVACRPRPHRELHADGRGARLVQAGLGEGAGGAADSSDDDLFRPTPPRFGDARQGSSRWTPGQSSQQAPPQDDASDSSDDDSGDYTRFYRHLGM